MRTNILIDDQLMADAMRVSGMRTKKAAVEEGLRLLVSRVERQRAFDAMAGIGWDGDLDQLRGSKPG